MCPPQAAQAFDPDYFPIHHSGNWNLDLSQINQGGPPNISAQGGLILDEDTKVVLWERQGHLPVAPASLTKVLTLAIAAQYLQMNDMLTVPPNAVVTDWTWSKMNLSSGEQVSFHDLILGVFMVSGNDAAETLAQGIMPRDLFIWKMNHLLLSLGLSDSTFVNPTGIDEANHLASPYDLAVVSLYLERTYPDVAALANVTDYYIPLTATHKEFFLQSLNRSLWRYPGAQGLKTGYTDNAGGCLILRATRNNRHLLVVVTHSANMFSESEALLDYGFSIPSRATLTVAKLVVSEPHVGL